MQEKVFQLLFNEDEVTWQSLLYELVKTEQMDPWDIDVSLLAKRYIATIRKLKELDFRLSGKVLLAAAILLKIKSNRLVGEDLMQLDKLIGGEEEEELFEEVGEIAPEEEPVEKPSLIPRTPQPRKRKVSIYDLVEALEKALEVKQRRVMHSIPPLDIEVPKKTRDITQVIREVYGNIKAFFFKNKKSKLMFSQLVPSDKKEDKIYTFVPLLHLTHQRKIELEQPVHFEDIEIMLRETKKEVERELS
jgi:segregation and condensation protein A